MRGPVRVSGRGRVRVMIRVRLGIRDARRAHSGAPVRPPPQTSPYLTLTL